MSDESENLGRKTIVVLSISKRWKRILLWIAIVLIVLWTIRWIYRTLGFAGDLLIASFFASYLMHPIVVVLERRGIRRWMAVVLTVLIAIGFLVLLGYSFLPFLYDELVQLSAEVPQIVRGIISKFADIARHLHIPVPLNDSEILDFLKAHSIENLDTYLRSAFEASKSVLFNSLGILIAVIDLVFLPLFFYFLMANYEKIWRFTLDLIPPKVRPQARSYLERFNRVLAAFIRGQLVVCFCLATIYGVGLWLIGIKFGFLVGVVAGVFSFIPYVGLFSGLTASLILAIVYSGGLAQYLGIAITFAIGSSLENFVIIPFLVGHRVGLSPLTTMIAIIAGGHIAGFMGMLVAIPIGGMIKIVLMDLIDYYKKSELYRRSA